MSVYAIGDVQGCYASLRRLLDKLSFDAGSDELWLTGDLVNRGPASADVVRFVKDLPHTRIVLGNHDLHLLAVAEGFRAPKHTDSFSDILAADDREELLSWLRNRPIAHFDSERKTLLVHAGLHPRWSLTEALDHAREIELLIRNDETYPALLARMYGDEPASLSDKTVGDDKSRFIINAFTRIRYCYRSGDMDFAQVGPLGTQPDLLFPWFSLRQTEDLRILFGHWSSLGARVHGRFVSLDSGCVHGGYLSAIDVDNKPAHFVQVPCIG
ncbi:MAG: symmetrical bis(5'-nucleosyl)-tetraphosphatase [Arenicellales bacterium]|nr:symmetrical bis(5'-nucleosyl)-tetraphosphatase [Arenicellales bacterium]